MFSFPPPFNFPQPPPRKSFSKNDVSALKCKISYFLIDKVFLRVVSLAVKHRRRIDAKSSSIGNLEISLENVTVESSRFVIQRSRVQSFERKVLREKVSGVWPLLNFAIFATNSCVSSSPGFSKRSLSCGGCKIMIT